MKISVQIGSGSLSSRREMANGQDMQQNGASAAPSGTTTSLGPTPGRSSYHAHNGEAATAPRNGGSMPEAASSSQPVGLTSLEGCKQQVAQLVKDEALLEAELKECEICLGCSRKRKEDLEQKIVYLSRPLKIDLDNVELTDEDMKDLTSPFPSAARAGVAGGSHRAAAASQPSSSSALPEGTADLIAQDAVHRLVDANDVAELNPLQGQHFASVMVEPSDEQRPQRCFGAIPVMARLPDDTSIAAILTCNRYRSTVSHIHCLQRLPAYAKQAAFGAQHFMSGRQWVMMVKPQAGAAWSLPGVQETISRHREQVSELSAALRAVQDQERAHADAGARQIAAQIASLQHKVPDVPDHPARGAVSEHLHNFRCTMPVQLNQQQQWRGIFADGGSLIEDPVALLQEKSFTSPWTKRERELMDNMLGEQGKKFAHVARQVGTRSIADCIDRYYKVHLRDEFKPTWRKMARIKRAAEGKHKREEHSKVLAPVSRAPARPRHSVWTGGAAQAGPSASVHWPPMSTARLTAAATGHVGDFGMSLAALESLPDSSRTHSRQQERRRGATTTFDNAHVAGQLHPGLIFPAEGLSNSNPSPSPFLPEHVAGSESRVPALANAQGASMPQGAHASAFASNNLISGPGYIVEPCAQHIAQTADAELVPKFQIAHLNTMASTAGDDAAVAGSGQSAHGSMADSDQAALQAMGTHISQGDVPLSFPALDLEIAAEGARAAASLHIAYEETQRPGAHVKGALTQVSDEAHPVARGASMNEQFSHAMQIQRGDGRGQHQS
eukprot:jgi/Ulvmu1/4356/UM002_0081.1